MKQLNVWLNEEEYKRFVKHVQKRHLTPYGYTKQLILSSMENPKEYERKMSIIYGFVLYSLTVATIVLVL